MYGVGAIGDLRTARVSHFRKRARVAHGTCSPGRACRLDL